MRMIQAPIAIGKANECEDIHDAGIAEAAAKLVRLGVACGWPAEAFVMALSNALNEAETDYRIAGDPALKAWVNAR